MRRSNKGFTLAELLIVVAIIAVLVASSIPIFTNQLEKARAAVDLSNVRSAYSVLQTAIMTETAPDGNAVSTGASFYIYTSSGTFKRHSHTDPVDESEACKLKSKDADFSQYVRMDWSHTNGEVRWRDCIIVVYYESVSDAPVMYVCPSSWIVFG